MITEEEVEVTTDPTIEVVTEAIVTEATVIEEIAEEEVTMQEVVNNNRHFH